MSNTHHSPFPAPRASFPYRVEELVGEGSTALVYRATEVTLDRPVALKVLKEVLVNQLQADDLNALRARFIQEARAAAALSHPNVATIYQVGQLNDRPYIAMEWLDGDDLETILERDGVRPPIEVVEWSISILRALEAAHSAGIIHRDVKPANIVRTTNGLLKLADFGIARIEHMRLIETQQGAMLGTPQYASPEQFDGRKVDARTDLFAVGVVMYEALCGRRPFAGNTLLELARALVSGPPAPLYGELVGVNATLDRIIMRALEYDADDRFPDAASMRMALEAWMHGQSFLNGRLTPLPDMWANRATPAPNTLISAVSKPPPFHVDDLTTLREGLFKTALHWPRRSLEHQDVNALLRRLIKATPTIAPFCGAMIVDDHLIWVAGNQIQGACHRDEDRDQLVDAHIEALPEHGDVTLCYTPKPLPVTLIRHLATLTRRPSSQRVDVSTLHLPALRQKLQAERFSGVLRFEQGRSFCFVILDHGEHIGTFASEGWGAFDPHFPWSSWSVLGEASLHVEAFRPSQVQLNDAMAMSNLNVAVEAVAEDDATSASSRSLGADKHLRPLDERVGWTDLAPDRSPIVGFAYWMVNRLPRFFAERQLTMPWRYLAQWLEDVVEVSFFHDLSRPSEAAHDAFDVVTRDSTGKVLHVVDRVAVASPETLRAFVEKVVVAKRARIKTGDVGGAMLVARGFEGDLLEAFQHALQSAEYAASRRWFFGLQRSLTGYSGFVRLGPRRGFHLLLVHEDAGRWTPVLPDESAPSR